MSVDFHAHLARDDPKAPPFLRDLFDVEGYLEHQADAGIGLTVLSYALAGLAGRPEELEKAKAQHEFLAGLVERHAGRFAALASVDPFGGDGWIEEGDRSLRAGFAGLCLPTSREGRYLDAEDAQGALALANDHGALVFLHPSDSPVSDERMGETLLRDWIGRPYDTGICLSRLLLADTMSRYPQVRIVAAHSGGVLPMLLGRLDAVHEFFVREMGGGPPQEGRPTPDGRPTPGPTGGGPPDGHAGGPPGGGPPGGGPPGGGPPGGPPGGRIAEAFALTPAPNPVRPSERATRFYLDTASAHPIAIHAAIATVGVDRVVLGTDFPPAGDSPKQVIDIVDGMDLAPDEREKLLSGNAQRLLAREREPATP